MKRLLWMVIFFVFSSFSVFAANPASKEYVDQVFDNLQAQINALNGESLTSTAIKQESKHEILS